MKTEFQLEQCCVCGGSNEELHSLEEYDAEGAPPLRTVLTKLAGAGKGHAPSSTAKLCENCARRAYDAHDVCINLAQRSTGPLGDRVRALRRRLQDLTQKIDVFIVVGGGNNGNYTEEDIIMVDKDALAAANKLDSQDHDRTQNVRGDTVYQCSVCPMSFQRMLEYQCHIMTHPDSAVHSCWTCGSQFASRDLLQEHSAEHNSSLLVCHLCKTTFQSTSVLRAHEATCPSRCPCCGLDASSRAELSRHVRDYHDQEAGAPWCCDQCFQLFNKTELLIAHQLTHRQGSQYVCGYQGCILRFASRALLMSHIRKCHSDTEPAPTLSADDPVPCTLCDRTFGSVAAMKRHARVHTKQVESEVESAEEGSEAEEGAVEYLEMETLDEDLEEEILMKEDL